MHLIKESISLLIFNKILVLHISFKLLSKTIIPTELAVVVVFLKKNPPTFVSVWVRKEHIIYFDLVKKQLKDGAILIDAVYVIIEGFSWLNSKELKKNLLKIITSSEPTVDLNLKEEFIGYKESQIQKVQEEFIHLQLQ